MPKKKHNQYVLFRKQTPAGRVWYVKFWDNVSRRYSSVKSTGIPVEGKRERRREAEEAARKLYEEFTDIKPAAVSQAATAPLIEYLKNFWTPDSEYAQFKRDVEKKPLTPYYIKMNHDDIRRHVEPFSGFEGVTVGNLGKPILKKWLIWLAGRKTQRRKKDGTAIEGNTLSGRRANSVIQAVRVAIRWAVDNEEINTDPFRRLGEVAEKIKEKGVLTFAERNKLTALPIEDYRTRLIVLLGSFCGLRRGEMRGLQWGDIADGLITVQHNFIDNEGIKQPKYNSTRKVPIPTAVQNALDIARQNARSASPENYVFESHQTSGKPLNNNFFREGVTKELESIGITAEQQKERVLTCHSLRHTFITLNRMAGVTDVEIQALAGHKDSRMTEHYSHAAAVLDFNSLRDKMSAVIEKRA